MRERGLKYCKKMSGKISYKRRSREGAWIEMTETLWDAPIAKSRSREGAWIEIVLYQQCGNNRLRRSREGAWIEIFL